MKKQAAVLRLRIEKERNAAGGRVRFTPRLRADVVSFAKTSGLSRFGVSQTLSIAESVLHRWTTTGDAPERKPAKLRRVKIVAMAPASENGAVVIFPGGARIEGLNLEQIRALMGGG